MIWFRVISTYALAEFEIRIALIHATSFTFIDRVEISPAGTSKDILDRVSVSSRRSARWPQVMVWWFSRTIQGWTTDAQQSSWATFVVGSSPRELPRSQVSRPLIVCATAPGSCQSSLRRSSPRFRQQERLRLTLPQGSGGAAAGPDHTAARTYISVLTGHGGWLWGGT
jgi:hypothetical protein